MPVIHTHVSVSTTPEQREALKAAYGKEPRLSVAVDPSLEKKNGMVGVEPPLMEAPDIVAATVA